MGCILPWALALESPVGYSCRQMATGRHQQLLEFLTTQFSGIDRQFDRMQAELQGQFLGTQGHLDEMERRLENLRHQAAGIQAQIGKVELRIRP